MHHFFVDSGDIEENIVHINGENYNHLKNVLRVKPGEKILISDGEGTDYECAVSDIEEDEVLLKILFKEEIHELPGRVYLFQGLPKKDKMELIIEKAVELGAYSIIPVETENTVVKLNEKKESAKLSRWNRISEAAAKQSKRSIIPEVTSVMKFKDAIKMAKNFDLKLIPYENAKNIGKTMEELSRLKENSDIAVFIGPEGGFSENEINIAVENEVVPVTLGKRILRTETAAITALSVIMITMEARCNGEDK